MKSGIMYYLYSCFQTDGNTQ